jgi:hypothetical protein
MRHIAKSAAIAAMLLGAVGCGFVPIREPEPEPHEDDTEPAVDRPIASAAPITSGFGARAERRRQARAAQRGAR